MHVKERKESKGNSIRKRRRRRRMQSLPRKQTHVSGATQNKEANHNNPRKFTKEFQPYKCLNPL
jgi:hypothetical protein